MVTIESSQPLNDLLSAGYQALAQCAWQDGFNYFQAALRAEESPEALEGLAMAAWWLDDAPVVFDCHERAYRLYRQHGDRRGAGRMATWLGLDYYIYRGDLAITNGWMQRAHRLLDGVEPSAEHGWLALWEAHIALLDHNDVALARRASARTFALAQALKLVDLEMLSLALEGLALVSEGQVSEGMRRLDESTTAALAGEMSDLDAIVTTCCYLIYACERIGDFDRAAQWCEKAKDVSLRWSYRSMFSFCRVHYAAVLIWRGDWPQAEAELTTATRNLMATRPGWAGEAILRLAELRRRQGRLDEAASLFSQASAHPRALLGRADLALAGGEAALAADLVERFLRRVPRENLTERAAGLDLAVRVHSALGNLDRAHEALAELDATAGRVGTEALRGSASFARGVIAAASGEVDAARRCFEDAVDHFQQHGAVFDAALARTELARILAPTERSGAAVAEARAALDVFVRIGAAGEADRATMLLRQLGAAPPDTRAALAPANLTRRECEVLCQMARGRSNHEIAGELFISVRTVERHISAIYQKIGAEGTAARSIATAFAIQHKLI